MVEITDEEKATVDTILNLREFNAVNFLMFKAQSRDYSALWKFARNSQERIAILEEEIEMKEAHADEISKMLIWKYGRCWPSLIREYREHIKEKERLDAEVRP